MKDPKTTPTVADTFADFWGDIEDISLRHAPDQPREPKQVPADNDQYHG